MGFVATLFLECGFCSFGFFPALCCGGDFATTSTARSKRPQASGSRSTLFSGFFVMDAQAVEQAKTKLRKAEKSLETLKAADGYDAAEEAWSDFLLAASTIYSKLEQGSKAKGSSAGWFGRKKKERKDDPVLRYLHHARNSDEHGIERVAARGGNERDLLAGEKLKFNERREYVARAQYRPKRKTFREMRTKRAYPKRATSFRGRGRLTLPACVPWYRLRCTRGKRR
jgi:hypothetical protein